MEFALFKRGGVGAMTNRRETGIHVDLETQDDHGYYTYGFDVFTRRTTTTSNSRRAT